MQTIVGRVTAEQKRLLDRLARLAKADRSKVLREILDIGLRQKLVELALSEFQKGKISLGKAAELAGVSLWEIIEAVREKKIAIHYTVEDLERDLAALRK